MRVLIPLLCVSMFIAASAAHAQQKVRISYDRTASPITAYSHYLENELSTGMSNEAIVGAVPGDVKKEERNREIDTRLDVEIKLLAGEGSGIAIGTFYQMNEKAMILRAGGTGNTAARGAPQQREIRMDAQGRPQSAPSLSEFAYISFPVILPEQPVQQGDRWSACMPFLAADGNEIDVTIDYALTGVTRTAGTTMADIQYRLSGELTSTDVTDDPGMMARIETMRRHGISRIAITGTGHVGFDLEKHLPVLHVTDLVLEIAQKAVVPQQVGEREKTVEMHKAEAMLAL